MKPEVQVQLLIATPGSLGQIGKAPGSQPGEYGFEPRSEYQAPIPERNKSVLSSEARFDSLWEYQVTVCKWLKLSVCKTVALGLCRFKSYP